MRIKSVHLRDYKRFTDLRIADIPESARLIVLIGPNGTGKSSVFDGFIVKSQQKLGNYGLDGDRAGYYDKDADGVGTSASTHDVAKKISIEPYACAESEVDWARAICMRTAYRHQADFRVDAVNRVSPASERSRFARIIDKDEAVSDNYSRMLWKLLSEQFTPKYQRWMIDDYHRSLLQELQSSISSLFTDPSLELQDFGGPERMGSFRFAKGSMRDFHYKNLSGGEKAAFDLLLDLYVKRDEYGAAIYCIDEPEAHVATAQHGQLLDAMLGLLPEGAQLWIATHSIGFVRRAYQLMQSQRNVAFLDFSERDFDKAVTMYPRTPDASFWHRTYRVALADLADLIAPEHVVLCEGRRADEDVGFDADCYTAIFSSTHSQTMFKGWGGADEVRAGKGALELLATMVGGVTVWRLTDRDEMSEGERLSEIAAGVRVLRRREIENYLYDPKVIGTFLAKQDRAESTDKLLRGLREILGETSIEIGDVKTHTRKMFELIRQETGLPNLGNTRRAFAIHHLAPALRATPSVFNELREDVFPPEFS